MRHEALIRAGLCSLLIGFMLCWPLQASEVASESAGESAAAEPISQRWLKAITNDRAEDLASLLMAADSGGVDLVGLIGPTGRNALMIAAKRGDRRLAEALLERGADVQASTATGGTAFMFAALGGHQAMAEWLFNNGADVNAAGSNGWGAVMIATAKGYTGLLSWLLAQGADANRADVYRFTPLMRAIVNDHHAAVAVLLATPDIDVMAKDEAGNTALHHAAALGHSAVVEALLAAGANRQSLNRNGQRALE